MDPATFILIVQALQAAITAAPAVEKLVVDTKNYVTSLFSAGLISKAQQDQVHAHIDEICARALAGQELPEFTVEPDPV